MKARDLFIYFLILASGVAWVNTCNNKEENVKVVSRTEENVKKRADSLAGIDKRYKEKLAEREKESEQLFEKLIKTESLLQEEKAKVTTMQQKIKLIVKSDWEGISTEEKLEKCDSLREIVEVYEEERVVSDSITEAKVQTMHEIINLKDQQITECIQFYDSMKVTLEKSIKDTKDCSQEVEKLNKKLKRKAFFNKMLVGAGAIVTVVVGVLLMKNGK